MHFISGTAEIRSQQKELHRYVSATSAAILCGFGRVLLFALGLS